ncbi:MAG: hypothetical protein EKK46_01795 [Rhodocyclaceae bacterium]|nr:MAG: hypothetical protein EKK46_01795 [Rhodocyclaceae bacterium]
MWTTSPERQQSGFTTAAAIFIVVILAALGAFMVTISGTQQLGFAQDVTGSVVLQGARAGVDWGVYQVINNTAGTFSTNCRSAAGATVTFPSLQGMTNVTVRVDCTSATYVEGASSPVSYQIIATACNNATCPNTSASLPNLYVERRLSTLVTN